MSPEEIINYQPQKDLLKGRVILVTGAGSGIGKAAAITCAAHGATIILAGRTLATLEQTYDQIVSQGGLEPVLYPVDMEGATYEDYEQLCVHIIEQFGRLDGLLLNAGVLGQRTPLNNYRRDVWDKVIQINITAQFQLTQALMPALENAEDASVVFTTSSVGRKGRAFWGAYAVSKFAVEGMMETWAAELDGLGPVRVNAINPGATRTTMRAQAYPAENPASLKSPEEIMPAYLYLLGPDSAAVNGQSVDAQPR